MKPSGTVGVLVSYRWENRIKLDADASRKGLFDVAAIWSNVLRNGSE
jgi:hypothetical protein